MSELIERVAQRMADEVLLKHQLLLDDQAKTLARAAIEATRVEEILSKLKNARNILADGKYIYAKEIDKFLESLK